MRRSDQLPLAGVAGVLLSLLMAPTLRLSGIYFAIVSLSLAGICRLTIANLPEEMAKIASHLATVGITRLALLHDERPDAKAVAELVDKAIAPSKAKLVVSASLSTGKGAMDKAVSQLQKAQPSAQAVIGTPIASVMI